MCIRDSSIPPEKGHGKMGMDVVHAGHQKLLVAVIDLAIFLLWRDIA